MVETFNSIKKTELGIIDAQFELRLGMLAGDDPVLIVSLIQSKNELLLSKDNKYIENEKKPKEHVIYNNTIIKNSRDNHLALQVLQGHGLKPIFVSSIHMNAINHLVKEGVKKL